MRDAGRGGAMRAVAVAIVLAMPLAGSASAAPAADPVGWQRPLVRIATEARRWLGDPHVAIVGVYSTTARALARASNQAVPRNPTRTSTSWSCTVTSRAGCARARPAPLPSGGWWRRVSGAPHAAAAGVW